MKGTFSSIPPSIASVIMSTLHSWVSQGAVERGCPKLLKSFWWAVACPEGPPSRADPKFQEAFEAPEPWRSEYIFPILPIKYSLSIQNCKRAEFVES